MRVLPILWTAASIAANAVTDAQAAVPAVGCNAYVAASTPAEKNQASVIPDELLTDLDTATPCFVSMINNLKSDVGSKGISADGSARLLSITAALRTITARLVKLDEDQQANGQPKKFLDPFIAKFRQLDDIDTVAVLAYGVRSEVSDLRLNSLVILGNIIDNKTVCVALAHLNDPTLLDSANGANGRANLLATIAVPAPWAFKENFENISRTAQAINGSIDKSDPNLRYTAYALDNINERLKSQKPDSNKKYLMPDEWRSNCHNYVQNFVPRITTIENVQY